MWKTLSFDSVSSRARAVVGKLRGAVAGIKGTSGSDSEEFEQVAGESLSTENFEVNTVEGEGEKKVRIYTSKPIEPAYFDEVEEFTPTIVGCPKVEVPAPVAEPVRKKEKFVSAEPADIFINALRRPVQKKAESAEPVVRKVAEAPVPEVQPVMEAPVAEPVTVEPIIETIKVEEVSSILDVMPADAEPVVIVESQDIDNTVFEVLESAESQIDCEIAHDECDQYEISEPVYVSEEIVSEAAPAAVLALPAKIEVPELEVEENNEVSFVGSFVGGEAAETSVEASEIVSSEDNSLLSEMKELAPVILNDERDVLMAFMPELALEENEFVATAYDDNRAFREDYLDETERTFKIRVRNIIPEQPRFDGNFRSLCRY